MHHPRLRLSFALGVLLGCLSPSLRGQASVDSLLQVAQRIAEPASRLAYLDSLCLTYHRTYPPGGETLFQQRQALAQEIVPISQQVAYLIDACDYFLVLQYLDEAEAMLTPYMAQLPSLTDPKDKLGILGTRGALYANGQQHREAAETYAWMLAYRDSTQQVAPQGMAVNLLNLGKSQAALGEFGQASVAFNRAKAYGEQAGDSAVLSTVLLELGILFSMVGLYDEAEAYITSRRRYLPASAQVELALDLNNLARNDLLQGRYAAAADKIQRALAAGPFAGIDNRIELFGLNTLIEAYFFLDQPDSVRAAFQRFGRLKARLNEMPYLRFLYDQSAVLDAISRRDYAQAETGLKQLYAQAIAKEDRWELLMYNQFFSILYERMGDHAMALRYAQRYSRGLDSTQTASKTSALLLYQTAYETREKEAQIETLEAEKALQALQAREQQNRLLGGLIGLGLLSGAALLVLYYRGRAQRAAQIEQLRTRISADLHDDIGSMLTGLSMQAELLAYTGPETVQSTLFKIRDLSHAALARMRDAVWAMDAQKDHWYSLIDRMREFGMETLEAREMRFSLETHGIEADGPVPGPFRQHVYLIFKEAVTNAAKHADGQEVTAHLSRQGKGFDLRVQDDGPPSTKTYPSTGQGLDNMRRRAAALGGTLETGYDQGFWVRLHVPAAF